MELEKISEFTTFAQTLKFTDAAQALHMSQSSLSKHIRDLEEELGMLLVERGAAGTGKNALTPAGRRYLELAGAWLDEHDAIVAECRLIADELPPARIHDVHCSFNVNAQLRRALEAHGTAGGNFAYVDTPLPLRAALDQGVIDFAAFMEPADRMEAFRSDELAQTYGWLPLAPEPLCFLVGLGNPLARSATISLDAVRRSQIITIETSSYTNWQNATAQIFAQHGCSLNFRIVRDAPLVGGAFPVGPRNLVLCTQRFAGYYQDLDVEDVRALTLEEFVPVVYPFLVYRRDTESVVARRIVEAFTENEGGGCAG